VTELGKYLYESGIGLILFYIVYWVSLRKDTNFASNRFYLWGSVILSMIIPLLNFSIAPPPTLYSFELLIDEVFVTRGSETVEKAYSFNILFLLKLIYFIGSGFFLGKFLFYIHKILRLIKKYGITKESGLNIVYIDKNVSPFSFLNIIFLNHSIKEEYKGKILIHERNHIKYFHSVDIILFELLNIVQWFNPVIWFYKWSLRELHEFQADKGVIKDGHNPLTYQELILSQVFGNQFFQLVNYLNRSIIKKRMIMMTKLNSSKLSRLKILLILPVALFLISLFAFSGSKSEFVSSLSEGKIEDILNTQIKQDTPVFYIVEEMPDFQGKGLDGFQDYLKKNIRYPEKAKKKKQEGRVFIQFIVNSVGDIRNAHVLLTTTLEPFEESKIIDAPLLEKEALRVVNSSPKWNPGIQRGHKVHVAFTLPVDFSLEPGKNIPAPSSLYADANNPGVFSKVDKMPAFQGKGIEGFREFAANNIKYPEEAKKKKLEGKIYIQCIINNNGFVKDARVMRAMTNLPPEEAKKINAPSLEKEALRVVNSSPKWEPGQLKGKPVNVRITFPVEFVLNPEETKKGISFPPISPEVSKQEKNELENRDAAPPAPEKIVKDIPEPEKTTARPSKTSEEDEPVFYIVEEMPDFQGKGIEGFREWVAQNLRYPENAVKNNITGRVFVQFVVRSDGSVDSVIVVRGVNPDLDNEAVRVVNSSPKWTPGKQRGIPVNVKYTFPITFSLDEVAETKGKNFPAMNFSVTDDNFVKIKADDVLFLIDGKLIKDSIQIPANEFKTIEILNGVDAIKEYGEKARNGVVIIKKDK
jgi:TonB family protein